MKKISPRTWSFIFAGLSLAAVILLAASINALQFAPGEPINLINLLPNVMGGNGSGDLGNYILAALRILIIIGWICLPLYVILLIFSKEARKRFLRDMMMLLPILFLIYLISTIKQSQNTLEDLNPNMFGMATQEAGDAGAQLAPPQFVPPPNWVTTLTTALIALAIVLVVVGLIYTLWRRSQDQARLKPIRQVEKEARRALDDIQAGGDLREVILRCYLQMVQAVSEYRNIHRDQDMTPHEFEVILEKRGLPGPPVQQLTQLFEQVRYGGQAPGRGDERTAVASLSAIVSACQRMK